MTPQPIISTLVKSSITSCRFFSFALFSSSYVVLTFHIFCAFVLRFWLTCQRQRSRGTLGNIAIRAVFRAVSLSVRKTSILFPITKSLKSWIALRYVVSFSAGRKHNAMMEILPMAVTAIKGSRGMLYRFVRYVASMRMTSGFSRSGQ